MANAPKTIVFGGTGDLGSQIVTALAKRSGEVGVVVRDASSTAKKAKLDEFKTLGVKIIEEDVKSASVDILAALFEGYDALVIVLGGAELEALSIKLVDAAKQAGTIKRLVPSEFGVSLEQLDEGLKLPPLIQGLFDAKDAVRKAVEASGIEYTYVINDAFADFWLPGLGSGGYPAPPDPVRVFGDGNVNVNFASLHDIGVATARAIDDPRAANKSLFVSGGAATQNEIIGIYERITGKTLSRTTLSAADLDKAAADALAAGDFGPAAGASFERLMFIDGTSNTNKDGPDYVNATQLYPDVTFESVEAYIQKVTAGAAST